MEGTRRQQIVDRLAQSEWEFDDLRREFCLTVKVLEEDLRHIERSVRAGGLRLIHGLGRTAAVQADNRIPAARVGGRKVFNKARNLHPLVIGHVLRTISGPQRRNSGVLWTFYQVEPSFLWRGQCLPLVWLAEAISHKCLKSISQSLSL